MDSYEFAATMKESAMPAVAPRTRLKAGIASAICIALTSKESGLPSYEWDAWSGLLAPAKTPRAIIDKLNREVTRILNLPEVQQRLTAIGVEAAPTTPAQLEKLIADQVALTTRLARAAGIKAN